MTPPWLDRTEYPFAAHYATINGYQLHYIDEGAGPVLLFVHGTPSWSFDWRNVIKVLRGAYRCIAIDHIGFGLSDKPEHYDYSPQQHSQTLKQFIRQQHLDGITLVVHDVGGPIGLHVAIQHPEWIERIVVLNSWLWNTQTGPNQTLLRWLLTSSLVSFLYHQLNLSPRFLMPASFGKQKLTSRIVTQYTAPFRNRTQRNGPLAFARSLVCDQDWFASLWAARQSVAHKPTLFIWGMKDPILKPHYLNKFMSGFPNSTFRQLAECGHFPQEEEPEPVARFITDWLGEMTDHLRPGTTR